MIGIDMAGGMQLSCKRATNKASTTWNRWLGADGLPSVVGSTSPSIKWSESIKLLLFSVVR